MKTKMTCVIEPTEYANIETRLNVEKLLRQRVPNDAREAQLVWTVKEAATVDGNATESRWQATITWIAA